MDWVEMDEMGWGLGGVKVREGGVEGGLEGMLEGDENEVGDLVVDMDGVGNDFVGEAGGWEWG